MDYVSIISTVGFPIAAFFYLGVRIETTVKDNTKAIQELKEAFLGSKVVRAR
jgi:hypothetical protein